MNINPNQPNPNADKTRLWLPQSALTPPPTPQIQHQQQNYNNIWQWHANPRPHHQLQQQYYGYGQCFVPPAQHFMNPSVWQHPVQAHQNYNNRPNYGGHNHQNQANNELRRLLNTQEESNKELTKEKSNLEGQIKELWAKLETAEKGEREMNKKFEEKKAEMDELLGRIGEKERQMESKSTETDPIELVEHPLQLPSPDLHLDPSADELLKLKDEENERLKNKLEAETELLNKMGAEMQRAKEDLEKFVKEQRNGDKERAKKAETLREWEERMNARERRFTEEKEIAIGQTIAQCRSEEDARITQIQLQLLRKSSKMEDQEKKIAKLEGLNRQICKELRDSKSTRDRLLDELRDSRSTKEHLLEEICLEREKLRRQANRCEELKLELGARNEKCGQLNLEMKIKNEEIEGMKEKHKMEMDVSLDAYGRALRQHDETIQKLRAEIEEKRREIGEKDAQMAKMKAEEGESWQLVMLGDCDRATIKKENGKLQLEKEELEEKAAKAMANAEMHKHKFGKIRQELATANEEMGKMKAELAKMDILMRSTTKECEEKQKQLDKMEAEFGEGKKKPELVLRIKREMPMPQSAFDEQIQAIDKKAKKGKMGERKKAPAYEMDWDYAPPGAKKKRIALKNDPNRPTTSSISAPSTSSRLMGGLVKKVPKLEKIKKLPTKLRKSIGDEALMMKMGASAYFLRQRGQTIGATTKSKGRGQMEQENFERKMAEFMAKRCEGHLYSDKCEKCKQKYGI